MPRLSKPEIKRILVEKLRNKGLDLKNVQVKDAIDKLADQLQQMTIQPGKTDAQKYNELVLGVSTGGQRIVVQGGAIKTGQQLIIDVYPDAQVAPGVGSHVGRGNATPNPLSTNPLPKIPKPQ